MSVELKTTQLDRAAVRRLLEHTSKGKVRQTKNNCLTVFENDPVFKDAIRYNILTGRTEIVSDLGWNRLGRFVTDSDMSHIYVYFEKFYDLQNEKNINTALKVVASDHQYHPIRDFLNSLTWDGTPRIRNVLHRFFGAPESDLIYACMRVFLLGAISRVFQPGIKFEYVIVLAGSQGVGKSTFLRYLAHNDDWFSDDIKRLDDENIYRSLQGHWVLELPEMLPTISAKSQELIKSFISRQHETYKVPYEVYPEDRPRQCVFGGTSNQIQCLPFDRTGNRRFLPIEVDQENAEVHILDPEHQKENLDYIDQMWAEAMEIYRSGNYSLALSAETERELTVYRQHFMAEDTVAGQIQDFLDHFEGPYVCSQLLYREALHHEYDKPTKKDTNEICEIMNFSIVGWKPGKQHRFPRYGRQRTWVRTGAQESVNESVNIESKTVSEFDYQIALTELTDPNDISPWE